MSNRPGRGGTGEYSSNRRNRSERRNLHKTTLEEGNFEEVLPSPLIPELFVDISETYWNCLKSVEDPRQESLRVYPLSLILHRIISGFLSGTRYIGVLFPKKQSQRDPDVTRQLGALPTRAAVYTLLRRIDWGEANVVLAPLWDLLGYVPELVVQRKLRDPQIIVDEFRQKEEQRDQARMQQVKQEREAKEKTQGMSAAAAKRTRPSQRKPVSPKHDVIEPLEEDQSPQETVPTTQGSSQEPDRIDLLLDGKVVKASYNMEVQERFVHVTHTQVDEDGNKHRHIVGAQETKLDRNGEWGAALSLLDALLPLPQQNPILLSGDAGFCVREFCQWLTVMGFFLFLGLNKTQEQSLIGYWTGLLFLKQNTLMGIILSPQDWRETPYIVAVFGE